MKQSNLFNQNFDVIDEIPIVNQSLMIPESQFEGLSLVEQICLIRYGTPHPVIKTTLEAKYGPGLVNFDKIKRRKKR